MKKYLFEGKTLEELKEKALTELNVNEEDLIILNSEVKSGLLKKSASLEVTTLNDIQNYIKETLSEILKLMPIDVKFEIRRRDKTINIKIFSNNNAILIGKNGRTIGALQTVIRQMLSSELDEDISFSTSTERTMEEFSGCDDEGNRI